MEQNFKVYKLNDYEWYITPWNLSDTLNWYNKEFGDDLTTNDVEESNLDLEGMWWETQDKEDIERLGDSDEIITIEKTPTGTKRSVCFGDLMRKDGDVYKYTSFKDVIKIYYNESIEEPEVIATTEW